MALIKHAGAIFWLVGIAAVVALTVWSGADLVGEALTSVGWGAGLVVMVRLATVSIAGLGWWLLFAPTLRPTPAGCVALRFVREAINTLLPMAQVGGDLIGARLVTLRGIPGPLAAANIIVDILVQAVTQLQFAVIGLVLLILLEGDGPMARTAAGGLAIAAAGLVGFYLVQRRSGQRVIALILGRLAGERWQGLGTVDQVFAHLNMIYADRRRFFVSSSVHLAGWLVGTLEVWVALALMGHPVGVAEAMVIESLMHAVRGAAFVIPGALGAQEGALVALCAIFAVPPDQALAVSLLKRVADLVVGIPGLVGWQMLEGARLKTTLARGTGEPAEPIERWGNR